MFSSPKAPLASLSPKHLAQITAAIETGEAQVASRSHKRQGGMPAIGHRGLLAMEPASARQANAQTQHSLPRPLASSSELTGAQSRLD